MQTNKIHKILAIDDQSDNLTTIKAILKSRLPNSLIFTALSGIEGIELAKKELPDVILLDIIMPTMDGYEVCRQLKADEQVKHIPVVMVTAIRTDVQSRVRALDLGADAFLSKPIDAIELIAQVNVMLRIKEAEDQLRAEKNQLELLIFDRTKELKDSEQKYKTLYNFAPIPYQSLNEDGYINDVNPEWLQMLGYERHEAIGKLYEDFIHPEDQAVLKKNFPMLKEQGHVHEVPFRLRHKDGHFIDVSLDGGSCYHPDGRFKQSFCVLQDITERKKAVRNLRQSEERYRNFISQVSEGVYRFELNEPMPINLPMEEQIDFMYEHMIIAECNQAFMQMYGYKNLEDVIGKSQLELHSGQNNPENRKALRDFITSGFRSENIETTEPDLLSNLKYFSNNSVGIIENGYLVRTWGTQTDITDRKATEIELIKFSKAVEQSPVSIMITNMEGAIEYANPKVSEITGYQKEELIGKNPRIFNSREQDSLFYDHLWNTISSGKDWTGEFHNKKKNGELFWEHASISPILNEKGEITHYLAFKEDITKRKQAEKALKESMLNFQLIFENSPIGIYMATKNGEIIDANHALLEILGSPSIEATKAINVLKFPPLVQNSYADKFNQCVKGGITIEFEMDYKSKWEKKTTLHSFLVPLKDIEGNVSNVYTLIEDITERKRSERIQNIIFKISNAVNATENLEQLISFTRHELGKIIDTSNFYLALYDEQTNSLSLPFFKDSFDNFDSFPAEKTITHYVIKQQKSLLADTKVIRALLDSGEVGRFGTDCLIWLGVPLKVNERIIGVLAVQSYTDEHAFAESDQKMLEFISDQISVAIYRKKAEEDLKEAKEKAEESDRLKSAFLANMSHEIRTPMNGILGFSDLLKQPGLSGEERRTFIDVIERAGQRMLSIINDIVDISKIESGQMSAVYSKVNINDQLNFIFDFFKTESSKKGIELQMNLALSNDEATIFVDGDKLYAVLMNLTKNASKYTRHGRIEIGYSLKEPSKEFLEFYVKDTGIGIKNERQDAIFERFIQADINDKMALQGAGLGLAISKAFVEMMGGKIGVESDFGKGSTFYFTIPYQQVKA